MAAVNTTGPLFAGLSSGYMEFTDNIVILRVGKFREADLWVRFLSSTLGVASAFAFGGSRSRRRFPGCLDTLNEVLVKMTRSRGGKYLNLEEGTLLKGPRRLRADWERLGLAINCLKFVEAFGIGPDGAGKAHVLLKEALAVLEDADTVSFHFPLFFRLRLAAEQGYAPELDVCQVCGKSLAGYGGFFQIQNGGMRCSQCPPGGFAVAINGAALEFLRIIKEETPSVWPSDFSERAVREQCARAVDGFIQYHVGLVWEHGYFRRV